LNCMLLIENYIKRYLVTCVFIILSNSSKTCLYPLNQAY